MNAQSARSSSLYARRRLVISAALLGGAVFTGLAGLATAATPPKAELHKLIQMDPWTGYLEAHNKVQHPLELLGGPIEVKISQTAGGVHVALPAHRKLDPNVFGTPRMPRAFAGTPLAEGLPLMMRETQDNHWTQATHLSPFGDKAIVMRKGRLKVDMVDATATDGATTQDKVHFMASWQDKAGNTYAVRCCKKLAHQPREWPTFGGAVTNDLMHGSSRVGTPLMPTLFDYAAFWGMGSVLKNGKVIDAPRLVHMMLTELVRGPGYRLDMDKQVTPTRIQVHLMVMPFMPSKKKDGILVSSPVKTGFKLPNGKMLPFWHVMFSNIKVKARRTASGWVNFPQQQ